jgi:hypothetical protein
MEEIYTTVEKETIKFSKPLNRNANDKVQNSKDSVSYKPKIVNESSDFHLPEDQITVNIDSRELKSTVQLFRDKVLSFEFAVGSPPYFWTCYDEFSRNYLTLLVSKQKEALIALIENEDVSDYTRDPLSRNVLQFYNPSCSSWFSTFNKVPKDARHLLCGRVASDINILLKLNQCVIATKSFEPLFGSMCLYTIVNDELVRITENFYFDATEESIREKFSTLYGKAEFIKKHENHQAIHIADGSGFGTHLNTFNLTIPEEFRNKKKDVFLIAHINKILSTDESKASKPYKTTTDKNAERETKHFERCVRLKKFRQPIGIAVTKLIDESGKNGIALNGKATKLDFSFYSLKSDHYEKIFGDVFFIFIFYLLFVVF